MGWRGDPIYKACGNVGGSGSILLWKMLNFLSASGAISGLKIFSIIKCLWFNVLTLVENIVDI